MKKFIIFIVLLCTVGLISSNSMYSADRPYYLLVDNIENQKGNGNGQGFPDENTTITNLIDLYYWSQIQSRPELKPWSLKAPFSPATFAQYPITSFDFVVIPLQDKGLDYSVGGIRVIDKINEMIAAGKDIIIVGSEWLSKSANDPESKYFVEQTLGLIPEQVDLISGNTFVGYDVFGDNVSPLTAGHSMHFNGGYTRNGVSGWPSRLYTKADMFTVKETSNFFAFNRTVEFGGTTKYVGGKIDIGQSTIACWSVDWSNCAGSVFADIEYTYKKLMELFLSDTPKPLPYLESEFLKIKMGSCEVGDSLFSTCMIRNFGRQPLNITNLYLWDTEQKCFSIVKNPKPLTLEPMAMKKLMIRFKPTEEGDFIDDIVIESDAMNCSDRKFYISLEATGGEKANYGPNMSITKYPIDFGKIMTGTISFADVEITNTGQSNLVIDSVYFIDKKQKDFIYADDYKMPQVVIPGNTYIQRIKFIPLEEDAKYTTKMRISTNSYNDLGWGKGIGYVTLVGETYSDKSGADMVLSTDEIPFGKCSSRKDTTLIIQNMGDEDLYISKAEFNEDCNDEYEAPFSFSPADIPPIKPGGEYKLTVTFDPPRDKEYYCDLKLVNNSSNPTKASTIIWVNGEGSGTSVFDKPLSNLISINVSPNPVSASSEVVLTIKENTQRQLEMYLVDISGKRVLDVAKGTYALGEFKFNLNKGNLPVGKYILNVKFGNELQNIPVIIK